MANVNVFQWMSAQVTQAFGQNGEKGTDLGLPIGTPIGSPENATVVYVGQPYAGTATSSLGYVVQLRGIDGRLWHFQHLMAPGPGLALGQTVSTGDVIGYSGGCATYLPDGSGCASLDPACSVSKSDPNCWSSGPHIETRWAPYYNSGGGIWGQNWQDSGPIIRTQAALIAKQYFANQSAPSALPGQTPQVPTWQISQTNIYGDCAAAYAKAEAGLSGADPRHISNGMQYLTCTLQAGIGTFTQGLVRVGLFILALVLIILGGIILIHPDPASIVAKAPGIKQVRSL